MAYPSRLGDIVVSDPKDIENPFRYWKVDKIEPPRQGKTVEEGYGWTEVEGSGGNWTGAWTKVPDEILAVLPENTKSR